MHTAKCSGTPMTRAKRSGLRRNALIAMAVTQHPRLNEAIGYAERDGGSPLDETLLQLGEWQARRT
jgi:epoxyqueuosine reductase